MKFLSVVKRNIDMKQFTFLLFFLCLFFACNPYKNLPSIDFTSNWRTKIIPPSPQLSGGDPIKGKDYLAAGDYIGSGIPWDTFKKKPNVKDTILNRSGENATLPYGIMVFEHHNGTKVFTGNCFTCHGGFIEGQYIEGLGGLEQDFSKNRAFLLNLLDTRVKMKFKKGTKEREAYEIFGGINNRAMNYIVTPFKGVNPAFRLEEAYVMRRNPEDLTLKEEDNYEMDKRYTLASDVPPWWHLKKKNGLYYNGMGRGDYTKLLMQASTQGIVDSTEAREIQQNFVDVLAYIESIEPPKYPKSINEDLANRGKRLFNRKCRNCHGTYGENETYPNKLVSLSEVKTDPYYARNFSTKMYLADWYNESWYGKSEPSSYVQPEDGYIAPPLDGIWATAPFFHNASVPTLEEVLNSKKRPTYWKRTDQYDYQKLGWVYEEKERANSKKVYDTTLPGYGKEGHYFGDQLTEEERMAVIEYLKTL